MEQKGDRLMGNEINGIFELNANEIFNDMLCDDAIHALLSNGYVLTLTPNKYDEDKYTLIFEVGEVDESFNKFMV